MGHQFVLVTVAEETQLLTFHECMDDNGLQ